MPCNVYRVFTDVNCVAVYYKHNIQASSYSTVYTYKVHIHIFSYNLHLHNRETHRQTASQPASQPARQAGRQADRQTDRHTHTHTHGLHSWRGLLRTRPGREVRFFGFELTLHVRV